MVSFPDCHYELLSRHVTLVKPLSIVSALWGLRMSASSWCPMIQIYTQYQRHWIVWAKDWVTAGSVRQNYSSEPDQEIALVLVREYWWGHDWKKKGNISGNSVTFPLFQASGHCASSEAISATRKWVTIKEERYNQPSSSAGWFWLRLPYTVFFYSMFWLLWGRTEEFIKEEDGQRCP